MGWKHLDAQPEAEKINGSIQEIIQGMARGHAAYKTDALKFGLYDVLRQKGSANNTFAQLRCPVTTCEARRQPVSYLSLRNDITCTKHPIPPFIDIGFPTGERVKMMVCSECGHARKDHCTWCKGCRGMFR